MHLSWHSQRGSTTLEAAIVLPLLLLLLLGGLLVALTLFIKASLTYHVFVESEEAALRPPVTAIAADVVNLVQSDPPPGLSAKRHHGFSLGVPLPNAPLAVSAACYSLPVGMPKSIPLANAPTSSKDAAPPQNTLQQLTRVTEDLDYWLEQAETGLGYAEDVVDQIDLARQVVSQATSSRETSQMQAVRLVGSWALDEGVQAVCRQDGPWVISVRAVARSEQTKGLR